jgi:hypothetical protein
VNQIIFQAEVLAVAVAVASVVAAGVTVPVVVGLVAGLKRPFNPKLLSSSSSVAVAPVVVPVVP